MVLVLEVRTVEEGADEMVLLMDAVVNPPFELPEALSGQGVGVIAGDFGGAGRSSGISVR